MGTKLDLMVSNTLSCSGSGANFTEFKTITLSEPMRRLPKHIPYFLLDLPVERRFASAFERRRTEGNLDQNEKLAFQIFPSAAALGEALFDHSALGEKAFFAMRSLNPFRNDLAEWFRGCAYVLEENPPIAVFEESKLQSDLTKFLSEFGREPMLLNIHQAEPISPLAAANIRKWFAKDIAIMNEIKKALNHYV